MTAIVSRTYPATGHILTFRGDGWFNMTQAAKAFGKELAMFWQNCSTHEYLLEVVELFNMGNSTDWDPNRPRGSRIELARGYLTDAKRGGHHTGTWAHPKLAVFFARWLDVKFAVWCDMQIDELIRGHHPDPCKGPTELPASPRLVRVPVTS